MDQKHYKIKLIGRNVVRIDEVDSTNEQAKHLALQGAREGTVVIAGSQTRGRGRLGRRWISPPGGIYLSVILKPYKSPAKLPLITLIASLAAVRTIRGITGLDAKVKWPNDLVLSGRKAGGILCETCRGSVIAGIGINVNVNIGLFPATLKKQITSIKFELGEKIDTDNMIHIILEEFDKLYSDFLHHRYEAIISEFSGLCGTLGDEVRIDTSHGEVRGIARSIGTRGELLVNGPDGKIKKVYTADAVKVAHNDI